MHKEGLQPIIDENTEILILGSLPGDTSISMQQYYANSSNDFWKMIGAILNEIIPSEYDARVRLLHKHHIGLWDVYHSCHRPGSSDKDITNRELNDFNALKKRFPKLRLICFNGNEAGLSEHILKNRDFKTIILPSSSGANRRYQDRRLQEWKAALKV